MRITKYYCILLCCLVTTASCEKLVTIEAPVNTVTTDYVFSTDESAKSAMAGVYSRMANESVFYSTGTLTILGGYSADEINHVNSNNDLGVKPVVTNQLMANETTPTNVLWTTAYKTIYDANSIIEGIHASQSTRLTAAVRKKLMAEARFLRAFAYFYLTNLYGDLPLALTIDFNVTRHLVKSSQQEVYKQIIDDLLFAQTNLPPVNTNIAGEKVYPDKWAATALLARVYLYTRNFEKAYQYSNDVIVNNTQLQMETDLNKVFLNNSKEAIWQLKQNPNNVLSFNATFEGTALIPEALGINPFYFVKIHLTDQLLDAFEAGDQRKTAWVGKSAVNQVQPTRTLYFVHKFKTGFHNRGYGAPPSEYYMPLRLAEQYLIRAEAAANGAATTSAAVEDLNEIRGRTGLDDLPENLTQPEVLAAIEQERRIELFAEWGHRWLDLKRTGRASTVLSQIPSKQPWAGDYQLFYPVPQPEVKANSNLKQNSGYQ